MHLRVAQFQLSPVKRGGEPDLVRYPLLDGSRGVAAVAVMLYHIGQINHVRQLVPFGFLSVDLFFMISGFVIARAYEPNLARDLRWRRFAILRVARIYPALLLGVTLAAVVQVGNMSVSDLASEIVQSLLLLPNPNASVLFPLNAVLWSLFYELVLNLVHAAVARWFTVFRVVLGTIVCGVAFAAAIWVYHSAGIGWDGHSFGAGFARAGWGYGVGLTIARIPLRLPSWISCIILSSAAILLFAPGFGFSAARVLGSLFVLLPLVVVAAVSVGDSLKIKVAGWLGGLSYPLYTIHSPMIAAAMMLPWRTSVFYWTAVAAGLVLISAAIEIVYDAPVRIALKRAFVRLSLD